MYNEFSKVKKKEKKPDDVRELMRLGSEAAKLVEFIEFERCGFYPGKEGQTEWCRRVAVWEL